MKATRKTVDDAIECLLACAVARVNGVSLCTSDVCRILKTEQLASSAWLLMFYEHGDARPEHIYGAAASLLHEGWLPEGWTS